jgi:protein-tyrosine kinase
MSRIDEALQRSLRPAPPLEKGEPRPVDRTPENTTETFKSPWAFTGGESASPVLPVSPPGVAAPVREDTRLERAEPPAAPRDPATMHVLDRAPSTPAIPVTDKAFRSLRGEWTERLALPATEHTALAEQYRHLAASLHHAQIERGIKSILVVSALPGEGKTLTAANVALTLSESYHRKVILIDADLRRPSLHDVFQVPNVSGLSDGLKAQAAERLSLLQVGRLLTLLPAGRPDPDPMASLTSKRMKNVLGEAVAAFDWVVVDTPPIALLPDANLLAGMVDAAILVVRSSVTPYAVIERAINVFGRERILGVVLNGAERQPLAHDYYHYHYSAEGQRAR